MRSVSTPIFETMYKRLNLKQKEAVDAIEGSVMVIAGPGTGKTSILTLRIANILQKTDTRPEQILALTFTESGVQSMRSKLIEIIGATAYKVNIFTFHGFANFLIKRFPDEFPRIISAENASEVQKVNIIESIIDRNAFEILKPYGDTYFYVSSVLASIRHLKREGISVFDFKEWIVKQQKEYDSIEDLMYDTGAHKGKIKGKYKNIEKDIKKNGELLKIYEMYEEILQKERLYDFEDMLLELIKAMKGKSDFLLSLQEEYQYILADEHQDANNSQNSILELLASFHSSPNLFIVGDEKQAIFRFQGASLENFLYFKSLYKDVTLITLSENYRSTQSILDASHELMSQNIGGSELRVRLMASMELPEVPVEIVEADNDEDERSYLTSEIAKLIQDGVRPQEIAVLYRKNKEADALMSTFSSAGIPFSVFSDRDMLGDHDVRKLLLILQAINDPSNDNLISEISFFDLFDLSLTAIYSAFKKSREKRQSIIDSFNEDKKLASFVQDILKLSSIARNEDLMTFFHHIFSETAWGAHLAKGRHPLSSIASFDAFLNEAKKYAEGDRGKGLKDFLDYLRKIEEYRIRISPTAWNDRSDAISLMTAHKSKGLEFEYVFITGVTDKTWGNSRDIKKFSLPYTSPSTTEDDRRLFYVALTRAKKKALVTWSNISFDGKPVLPSQFIVEMKEEFTRSIKAERKSKKVNKDIFHSQRESIIDPIYLRTLFLNETFSVTALNNYLSCPWKYFFRNLIRLPEIQTKHQLYGTAVHNALSYLVLGTGKIIDKKKFLQIFERELDKLPFSQNDFEDSLSKGKKALAGYYDTYSKTWETNILTEYSLAGAQVEIPKTDHLINLRGIIDKIELSKPLRFEPQQVHVVDYKTRKPLSRNEIEGKTKNATGDYKRQLTFYKFLLDQDTAGQSQGSSLTSTMSRMTLGNRGNYEMTTGEIDFIEPDEKGNYRKEVFEITKEDVSELEVLLQDTLSKIYSFDFLKEHCDDKECEECKLARLIK